MNKIIYDLLLKLEQCDDKHNRCDYLMEHDEITYLLEYIEMLEDRRKQNVKYKEVLDKIKEYIENTDDFDIEIFDENSGGCLGTDLSKGAKHILELLEEIE